MAFALFLTIHHFLYNHLANHKLMRSRMLIFYNNSQSLILHSYTLNTIKIMCGIAGYITKKKYINFTFEVASKKLKELMKNRGPDQQGSFCHTLNNYIINLFSSRLSIIDLDTRSNQPFKTNDTVLIFNGEIYNYVELKKELQKKNVHFKTNSDTEVLIKAYECWGEECVNHIDGMWSFCIYDYKNNKIFLSRDNFGEKPLYYFLNPSSFYFSSQISIVKKFLKNISLDFKSVATYLTVGYTVDKKTMFKNILAYNDQRPKAHSA
jgi:asparagine synthase (glutamine-hydrolysing)